MKKIPFVVDSKIIYIDFEESKNKNMYLKITKKNKVLITAPKSFSEKEIKNFVSTNIKKIMKYLKEDSNKILYSLDDDFIYYKGIKLKIRYLTGFLKPKIQIKNNIFYIMSKEGNKNENEKLLKDFLHSETLKYVKKRQLYFEKKMNVPPHKIKVTYKFATWGTNNISKKIISYTSRLTHFNDKVKDYLIVHELAHFHEPNHSPMFYDIIKEQLPEYSEYEKQLSKKSKISDF